MRIALLGAGNMGSAIARGVIREGVCAPEEVVLIDQDTRKLNALKQELRCAVTESCHSMPDRKAPEIFIIAIKPQIFESVAADIDPVLSEETLLISVMAGISLDFVRLHVPSASKLVRVMPNLPAAVGKGVSVLHGSSSCTPDDLERVQTLFRAIGECIEVQSERLVNAATAVSGSGPGFVFHLLSAGIDAAEELGFSSEQARKLVFHTSLGALELWNSSGDSPEEWESRVASPGGTTEAGLTVLRDGAVRENILRSISRAYERANELAEG